MSTDPNSMQDPRTKHRHSDLPEQEQTDQPGHTGPTGPTPDHGEQSWTGHGRLQGRKTLITGGDSGIGRATAIAFAREGSDVAIAYLPEEEEDAQVTASHVREAGRTCLTYPVDITEESNAVEIVRRTVEDLGGIDVLILNAAYQRARDGIDSVPTAEVRKVFETNLVAHIVITREAVPHLNPGASIIVTTSIQAAEPKPPLFDYAMTKAAQVAFIEAMASELGEKGIRSTAWPPARSGPRSSRRQASTGSPSSDRTPPWGARDSPPNLPEPMSTSPAKKPRSSPAR